MSLYAIVQNGVCEGLIVCDATFAQQNSYVGPLDNLTTIPAPGWTYNGTTWAPSAQVTAQSTLNQLKQTLAGHLTQAEADLTTLQTWQAGTAPSAAHLQVLLNCQNGWISLLEGLQVLVSALGF